MKHFFRRSCRGISATKEALFRRCGFEVETMEHSLLLCDGAKRVWFGGPLAIRIDASGITSFHCWCENMLSNVLADDIFAC